MNLNDYKGILVYAEQRDGVLQNVGLELLGKATELAYEINKQIALKDAGDELAEYASKQAAAIKSIDAVAATLEEEDEKVKEKVAEVKANNPDAAKVTALLIGHNVKALADELVKAGADKVLVVDQPKLEVYDTDEEFSTKLKEIKQNILNKENKISIFSQFSDFISLIYQTRKNKFSKLKILEIIAKHKKYITEFRNNKSK